MEKRMKQGINGRFVRLSEDHRPPVTIHIDHQPVTVQQGDTLMVAILTHQQSLRNSDFDAGHRAGFCLMGACQDCWVWTETGQRIRACSTYVTAEMAILTQQPEVVWQVHES
ncbi:(2Fe-2S)-binding protein [Vibrio sp. PP-XX7]